MTLFIGPIIITIQLEYAQVSARVLNTEFFRDTDGSKALGASRVLPLYGANLFGSDTQYEYRNPCIVKPIDVNPSEYVICRFSSPIDTDPGGLTNE